MREELLDEYVFFISMENIFKIRNLGVCRKEQAGVRTAFTCYEIQAGEEIRNRELPLHYMFFILGGVMDVSYNQFENRRFQANEMIFLLRSSSVRIKILKKVKLFVLYFDTLLSPCDRHFFKAYLPDAEKIVYDFRPIAIPHPMRVFLEQILYFQSQQIDCMHLNEIKHCEFFILLRALCPRKDIVDLLFPLIGSSMTFRNKVLEKYPELRDGGVTELAGLVGMGRKTFDKRFREEFGESPAKWIQQETAKRLRLYLMEPGVTINDAMDTFHFNSSSHFNRFCRQYFNKTPGMIIKEAQTLTGRKTGKQLF
jgi:AraC-like DNA-binding protein